MVDKAPQAFRTISEVADALDVPAHVLRFWESRFTQIKPIKRGGGRRYYRPTDVDLIRGIQTLLYGDGLTIKGAQKVLREKGVRHVMALGSGAELPTVEMRSSDDLAETVAAAFEDKPSEPNTVKMVEDSVSEIDPEQNEAPDADFGASFAQDAMESGVIDANLTEAIANDEVADDAKQTLSDDILNVIAEVEADDAETQEPDEPDTTEPEVSEPIEAIAPRPTPVASGAVDPLTPVPVDPSIDLQQLHDDDALEPEVEDIIESPAAPDKTEQIRAIVRKLERLRDQMKSV